jgi:hypothetical protein
MNTPDLVTMEEARTQLRMDADLPAGNLGLYITAASEQCVEFLGRPLYLTQDDLDAALASVTEPEEDPNAMVVNASIKAACLMQVETLMRHAGDSEQSPLNRASTNLLWKFRVGLGA